MRSHGLNVQHLVSITTARAYGIHVPLHESRSPYDCCPGAILQVQESHLLPDYLQLIDITVGHQASLVVFDLVHQPLHTAEPPTTVALVQYM